MNDRFERLLKSRIGLDASSVGSAVIERAVRQRMSGLALHDEDEYWMRLNGSPGEVQALIEAVVVPETWFFRYPESFTTLARLAFERLPSLGGGRAPGSSACPVPPARSRIPSSWPCSMPGSPSTCSRSTPSTSALG